MNTDPSPTNEDSERLVSVVIPAYNCENTIERAIRSCLEQDYPFIEVVVVDDGSTDQTAAVLKKFGARIIVLGQSNGGLACARNAGVAAAKGEFVALMDGDDIARIDRISAQVATLKASPTVQLVSSDFSAFSGKREDCVNDIAMSYIGSYYGAVEEPDSIERIFGPASEVAIGERRYSIRQAQTQVALLRGNFVHPPTVMIRRALFESVGLFDESLRSGSDYDFIIRAAGVSEFAFIDASLLHYRISERQMSSNFDSGTTMLENVKVLEKLILQQPELYKSHTELFDRRIAESLLSAAQDISERNRLAGMQTMVRSFAFKFMPRRAAFIAARTMSPRWAFEVIRGVRRNPAYMRVLGLFAGG